MSDIAGSNWGADRDREGASRDESCVCGHIAGSHRDLDGICPGIGATWGSTYFCARRKAKPVKRDDETGSVEIGGPTAQVAIAPPGGELCGNCGAFVLSGTGHSCAVKGCHRRIKCTRGFNHEGQCDWHADVSIPNPVSHPSHYTSDPSGVECIAITRHRNFNVGNAIKYLWRAGLKEDVKHIEDLKKARWYLADEIRRLGGDPDK